MTMPAEAFTETDEKIGTDVLKTLFLFESLDEDKLTWLCENGRVQLVEADVDVFREGEPATCFYVMISGDIALRRKVQTDDVEINRTQQPGVYAGATQAYIVNDDHIYPNTLHTFTQTKFFVLPADVFGPKMREWFPMAMHLLEGLFLGMRRTQATIAQRQRLLALGQLSAGLTHELNNPAAAAVRASASLRERVARMRHKLTVLASGDIPPEVLTALTDFQEKAIEGLPDAPDLSVLETSDREDAIGEWFEDQGIPGGWNMAPIFVAAGLDLEWVENVHEKIPGDCFGNGIAWISYAIETEMLMNEIHDSTTRVSTLVNAAKQYSQMDRAEHQWVDVHEGIYSTLQMLKPKWGAGVKLEKDCDRTLPRIPTYPAELNQVWTNLMDNAVQAMKGEGTLSIHTYADGDCVAVEIGDTGPGIAPEIKDRIFEPFFTTKPVGEGTGLGLDISWRVIVQRHGGDLTVESEPGHTVFRVRLPMRETETPLEIPDAAESA